MSELANYFCRHCGSTVSGIHFTTVDGPHCPGMTEHLTGAPSSLAPAPDDLLAPVLPTLDASLAAQEKAGDADARIAQNERWALRHAARERDAVCEVLRVHGPFRSGRWLLDACTAAIQRVREER